MGNTQYVAGMGQLRSEFAFPSFHLRYLRMRGQTSTVASCPISHAHS